MLWDVLVFQPGYDNDEDIVTKAREIVDSVIHRVKTVSTSDTLPSL